MSCRSRRALSDLVLLSHSWISSTSHRKVRLLMRYGRGNVPALSQRLIVRGVTPVSLANWLVLMYCCEGTIIPLMSPRGRYWDIGHVRLCPLSEFVKTSHTFNQASCFTPTAACRCIYEPGDIPARAFMIASHQDRDSTGNPTQTTTDGLTRFDL